MQTRIIYFLTYPTAHSQSLRFFSLDLNERYETLLKDKFIVDALYLPCIFSPSGLRTLYPPYFFPPFSSRITI